MSMGCFEEAFLAEFRAKLLAKMVFENAEVYECAGNWVLWVSRVVDGEPPEVDEFGFPVEDYGRPEVYVIAYDDHFDVYLPGCTGLPREFDINDPETFGRATELVANALRDARECIQMHPEADER